MRPRPTPPASITAVLPAYNEEAIIAETLRATHEALRATGARAEVIVVDDGSVDGTRAECERMAAALDGVRIIVHPANRGYGGALRTGLDAASGTAVFLMDSDGQFDPSDIGLLIERWDDRTVVCGYRAKRRDPWVRRLNHRAFFAVVEMAFGRTARDVNCAFKLFPRAVGRGLAAEGALISTELLVRARDHGYRIVDVAVPHHPRRTGAPTGARVSVILRAFVELWRLRRRLACERPTVTPARSSRPAD
jgi:glycosyltransferase involved in cell wall biosynthesis